MFCSNCGKVVNDKAVICVHCGCAIKDIETTEDKRFINAFLLCFFLGVFGAHRFYTGHTGSAILQLLLTITILGIIVSGIWSFIDFILILTGNFKTADGKILK